MFPCSTSQTPRPWRRFQWILWGCLWLVLGNVRLATATAPATETRWEDLQVGFGGTYQLGKWIPLYARMQSKSSSPTADSLRLSVRASDPDGQAVVWQSPETKIGSDGIATFRMLFKSGRPRDEFEIWVESPSGQKLLQATLRAQANSSSGPGAFARGAALKPSTSLWGVMGLSPEWREAAAKKITTDSSAAKSVPTATGPGDSEWIILDQIKGYPEQAEGYHMLRALVWQPFPAQSSAKEVDTSVNTWSPAQTQALRDWVEVEGGHLILSVGSQREAFEASWLGKWLQLPITGEGQARQLDGLEAFCSRPLPLKLLQPVPILKLRADDNRVLVQSLDGPLVIQRAQGLGRVTFLALDLGEEVLAKWAGLPIVMDKLLRVEVDAVRSSRVKSSQLSQASINDLHTQLTQAMDEMPGVYRSPLWLVMACLGIYILLIGPIDYYLVQKLWKVPHRTWWTLTGWVVLSGVVVGVVANRLNGQSFQIRQVDVLDLETSARVLRGQSWLTTYSPKTQRAEIQVSSTGASPDGNKPSAASISWNGLAENRIGGMYRDGGVQFSRREYRQNDQPGGWTGYPLQVWSTTSQQAEWSARELPTGTKAWITAKLTSSGVGRLTGSISHQFAGPLDDCLLAFGNRVYFPAIRIRGERVSRINPHQTWELGGGQAEQRELRGFLTQVITQEVQKEGSGNKVTSKSIEFIQQAYNPRSKELPYLLQMLTFHQAAGGTAYTGLQHEVLPEFDLSQHLRLGRAVLVGVLRKPTAQWSVAGETRTDPQGVTFIRVVLPVETKAAVVVPTLQKLDGTPAPP